MRDAMLALLGAFTLVACSYNWSTAATVTADAGTDSTSALDGSAEADAVTVPESSPQDGPFDVTVEAPKSYCTPLQEAQVQQARANAIACASNTTACMTTVTDECECTVVVYAPAANSTATQDYLDAIAQLANCKPQCSGCPTPTEGICLVTDAGSGAYACYQ